MMELAQKEVGPVVVIKAMESRLDARSANEFKERMEGVIRDGHSRIVLDLSAVAFVDSSGLGAIVSSLKSLEGGGLAICGARDAVRSMLKLTRLDRVVRLCRSEEEAVAALAG